MNEGNVKIKKLDLNKKKQWDGSQIQKNQKIKIVKKSKIQ